MSEMIRVGITHGDINGIGYEVIVKSLAPEGITELFTPVIFGYSSLLRKASEISGIDNFEVHVVKDLSEIQSGKINVIEPQRELPTLTPGQISEIGGNLAVEALEMSVAALKNGDIDVLVTAPISKEAAQSEKFNFPGHTEYLENRIGDGNASQMILCHNNLRVALLSTHLPLAKVSETVRKEKIIEAVDLLSETLKKDFGIERPKIAVLSLNPHAGDGGVLGAEENEQIQPAIEELQSKGILAFGPYPSDGFFGHGSYTKFDGILAMYHDQGLAPFKTLAASGGVNFTASLPFVRTSPDHGTAFDIAWQGKADHSSMKEAIYMAIDIFRRREIFKEISSNPLKKFINEKPDRGER